MFFGLGLYSQVKGVISDIDLAYKMQEAAKWRNKRTDQIEVIEGRVKSKKAAH